MAQVTYSPLPKLPAGQQAAWAFQWHGVSIPVPAQNYRQLAIMGDQRGIMLVTDDKQFFTVDYSHQLATSGQSMPLIAAYWNNPTSLFDVIRYGYTVTPDALTCTRNNVRQQGRAGIALILKTMASPTTVVAAHKLPQHNKSILTYGHHSTTQDGYVYHLAETGSQPIKVQYRISANHPKLRRAALLFSHPDQAAYGPLTCVLSRLQSWIQPPDKAHYCKLKSALKKAHFNLKSIRSLAHEQSTCTASTKSTR